MIKIYTTTETANKLNTTDRSVRRLIASKKLAGVTLTPTNGTRTTYGVTEKSLNTFLRSTNR